MTVSARPPSNRRIDLAFLGLLGVLMLGLLVGPRVAEDEQARFCVVNVHLPGPFGLSLNCDSPEFMRLAHDPAALFEERNTRQSRPGLILAAAALEHLFRPAAGLAGTLGARAQRADIAAERIGNAMAAFVPAFAAYILLNGLLVWAAFAALRRIAGHITGHGPAALLLAFGLLLAANDVVKAFVWSPHTQMFNLLVPLLCVLAAVRAWTVDAFARREAYAWAAGAGLGMTAYATFLLVLPCLFAPLALRALGARGAGALPGLVLQGAALLALAAAPSALWYAVVMAVAGSYYHHELAIGQVVWMRDALQQGVGVFLAQWWDKAMVLAASAAAQAVPVLAALAVVLAVGIGAGRAALAAALRGSAPVLAAALLSGGLALAFFASTGLLVDRVAYAAVPPLLAWAAVLALDLAAGLAPGARRALAAGLWTVAAAQTAWTIVKDGPWS